MSKSSPSILHMIFTITSETDRYTSNATYVNDNNSIQLVSVEDCYYEKRVIDKDDLQELAQILTTNDTDCLLDLTPEERKQRFQKFRKEVLSLLQENGESDLDIFL